MNRKNLISAAFFLLLLTATIVVIFQGNDMNTVVAAMQTLSPVYLVRCDSYGFVLYIRGRHYDLVSSWQSGGENPSFFLHQIFVCGIFLFRYHTVCNRRTADASFITCRKKGIKYRTAAWCL